MSTPTAPSARSTVATAARIEASSQTSSASVLHPRDARSAIDSGLRAVAYTFHPRDARCSAVARPIPVEHPVIRTAFEIDSGIRVLRVLLGECDALSCRIPVRWTRGALNLSPGPAPFWRREEKSAGRAENTSEGIVMADNGRKYREKYGEWALVTGASAGIGLEF